LVVDNSSTGLFVQGSQVKLSRTTIRGTGPRLRDGKAGFGVYAVPYQGRTATLELNDCALIDNRNTGLLIDRSSAVVRRSEIKRTRSDTDGFGDGLNVTGPGSKITLLDSSLVRNARAGLLLSGASGVVDRSLLTGAVMSVVLGASPHPRLGDGVVMEGNLDDRLVHSLTLTAPPPPSLPPSPPGVDGT
jgi:hypothetical protein